MNWYKISQETPTSIDYLGSINFYGADFVQFKIGDQYWAYKVGFSDWAEKVKKMALYSPGKALAWVKENKTEAFLTTKDFPAPGSIIREEFEKEQERYYSKEEQEEQEEQGLLGV